ncbi:hypothetical protein [Thiobacillus denitrificans]|uniref:hypothetical protein n=1 Tax=Thiobacillus denitrificans TaxID=36861 RepID=UPI000369F4E8|nr:hypothetical protein [Thiobacillus denitrificans]
MRHTHRTMMRIDRTAEGGMNCVDIFLYLHKTILPRKLGRENGYSHEGCLNFWTARMRKNGI